MGAAAFRTKLALSGIVEYTVRVALTSGLLKKSNGCVILPTVSEVGACTRTATGDAQGNTAAMSGGVTQQPADILAGGGRVHVWD